MIEGQTFGDHVRRELGFLIQDRGFHVARETEYVVRLESETMGVQAAFDPRGEVAVDVFRLGCDEEYEKWSYVGMVGTASVPRLLQIATQRIQANDSILGGEDDFYERLGADRRRLAREWTAYYAGTGPRPQTQPLPP